MARPRVLASLALGCASLLACAEPIAPGETTDSGTRDPVADAAPSDGGAASDGSVAATDAAIDPADAAMPTTCPRVRVMTPGEVLNVRPSPSTAMAPIKTLPDGAIVEVVGTTRGEVIGGVDLWYEIRASFGTGFVFSSFVACTTDEIPEPTGYYVPFACGASVRVTQGPGGSTSHTGRAMYAFDFGVALETPIRAMAPGTVTYVFTGTGPGDPCYGGGGPDCGPAANLVIIQHADGSTAAYKHINSATVSVGATVARGDVIARSGSTGYSTGPHLHAEVRAGCPATVYCDTIPFSFTDVGTPAAPVTVVSGNCP